MVFSNPIKFGENEYDEILDHYSLAKVLNRVSCPLGIYMFCFFLKETQGMIPHIHGWNPL
jgi:hypothetical protein